METTRKVKERLTEVNENSTTMQQIYYYGKIVLIGVAVVGLLYLWYKYEASLPDTGSIASKPNGSTAGYTDRQTLDALKNSTLRLKPIKVDGTAVS